MFYHGPEDFYGLADFYDRYTWLYGDRLFAPFGYTLLYGV